jgi:RNA polymerase sigma factor (sigma-70 family)
MTIAKTREQYSDTEIIQKILQGEIALFEILIRRYNSFLYKTGRAYGYGHEDAQDLMQETYINTYLNLAKFENRSSFKTWITKIMLNNCFQKRQKFSYKYETASEEVLQEKSTPMYTGNNHSDTEKIIVNRELSHVLECALQQIPIEYRMVFSLREMNGFNVAETAEALSISESNVKVRLNRAKSMLRNEVEKTYTTTDLYEFSLIYCDAIVKTVMDRILALQ